MKGERNRMWNRLGWHATRATEEEIMKDKLIRPMRLPCVYLFTNSEDAHAYAKEFGYTAVWQVRYHTRQIATRWKASYGKVIRLKEGECATVNFKQGPGHELQNPNL